MRKAFMNLVMKTKETPRVKLFFSSFINLKKNNSNKILLTPLILALNIRQKKKKPSTR